ncbi:hypothetical protein BDN70DRAFT_730086 [Pholiota conissans]|uniref:Uncharacterized protein n=1 Tax=Pholiota conissans TaxID=109636 RepID=A0A9P5YI21_9AGAR|nr:hypothetical protein BDN70DRAFT_730086 [Pholiota conissans]
MALSFPVLACYSQSCNCGSLPPVPISRCSKGPLLHLAVQRPASPLKNQNPCGCQYGPHASQPRLHLTTIHPVTDLWYLP